MMPEFLISAYILDLFRAILRREAMYLLYLYDHSEIVYFILYNSPAPARRFCRFRITKRIT